MPGCILLSTGPGAYCQNSVQIVSCAMRQVIYSRNGVNITATPVEHYTTGGPSALRVDWNGLSFVYSGGRTTPYARTRILHEQHSSCGHPAHLPGLVL